MNLNLDEKIFSCAIYDLIKMSYFWENDKREKFSKVGAKIIQSMKKVKKFFEWKFCEKSVSKIEIKTEIKIEKKVGVKNVKKLK